MTDLQKDITLKSRFFKRFNPKDSRNSGFKGDINHLIELSEDQVNQLIVSLPGILLASTSEQRNALVKKTIDSAGTNSDALTKSLKLLTFFAKNLQDEHFKNDTPSDLVDDLIAGGMVEEKGGNLKRIIEELVNKVVGPSKEGVKDKDIAKGFLPFLSSVKTTVELRAKIKDSYNPSDPADDYQPEVEGTVGISSVYIGTDAKENATFYFQADEGGLKLLISKFQAALKELQALKAYSDNKRNEG